MSIAICDYCERRIDTDVDPESTVAVPYKFVCRTCRREFRLDNPQETTMSDTPLKVVKFNNKTVVVKGDAHACRRYVDKEIGLDIRNAKAQDVLRASKDGTIVELPAEAETQTKLPV